MNWRAAILLALPLLLAACAALTPLEISPDDLPDATVGQAYSVTLHASGGSGPTFHWKLLDSNLPTELSFKGANRKAVISGTPLVAGNFRFTLRLIDSFSEAKEQKFTLRIVPAGATQSLSITTTSLPDATVNAAYSAPVVAQGGSGVGYAWSLDSGSLPAGLTLNAGTPSAAINGVPTTPGGSVFTVRVTDSQSNTATKAFSITVNGSITITPQLPFPPMAVGGAYAATLTGSGGTGVGYAWSISAGALPPGLSLGATGTPSTQITGTPTLVGRYTWTVLVQDNGGNAGALAFDISVGGPLTIITASLPNGVFGGAYSAQLEAGGGAGGPYDWSISQGALPPGLSLNTSTTQYDSISGYPTALGTYNFRILVLDSTAAAEQAFSINITTSAIDITTTSLPFAEGGVSYQALVTASGGTQTGYVWSIIGGALPPGVTLSSGTPSATLSGIATGSGDYTAMFRVADSASFATARSLTIHVPVAGEYFTLLGQATGGFSGDGGRSYAAKADFPSGVAVDATGNLFFADTYNNRIRRIDALTRIVTTVAGTGIAGFTADGIAAVSSGLNNPWGIALDAAGNLFIADTQNNRVRRVDAGSGLISTVAGNGTAGFSGDGALATAAQLDFPINVAVDGAGNLYICDYDNFRVRRVSAASGNIFTFAGNGLMQHGGDSGPATSASIYYPTAVAFDSLGRVLIGELYYYVRRVDSSGVITTIAGVMGGGSGGDGGPASAAPFVYVASICVDAADNIYILDGYKVRRIDAATGIIDDYATAQAGIGFNGGLAVTPNSEKLFICDATNDRIRVRIHP